MCRFTIHNYAYVRELAQIFAGTNFELNRRQIKFRNCRVQRDVAVMPRILQGIFKNICTN